MSSSKSSANGSVLAQGSGSGSGSGNGSGRRSTSFEKHRRRSGSGDMSMVKLAHSHSNSRSRSHSRSHSRTASGASGSGHGMNIGQSMAGSVQGITPGTAGAPVVPPPPKERLLPSPPLTPVASLSSLRKTAGKERVDVEAMPKSGRLNVSLKGVAAESDRSELVDGGLGGAGADGERDAMVEDGLDTERDGTLSSWSFRPDGAASNNNSAEVGTITNATTTTSTDTATSTDGCGTEDNNAGLALPFTGATAPLQPLSEAPLDSSEHDIPQDPQERDRDPLSASGPETGESEPHASSNVSPPSMPPPGHEATSPPHPLYNGPSSPQPWDLVEPPPNNNEAIMRRMRKDSNRSVPGSTVNVVVKDGKKYRIPHSSYYFGPPPSTSAFGTDPIGQIGVHHPREIIRIERDYSAGDLAQFSLAYPLELEGRITPTKFLETINAINEALLDAHSLRWSFLDHTLALLTLYISRLFIESNYDRKMRRLRELIEKTNKEVCNPVGLNILWPKDVAFMFLEIEYY